MKWSPKTEKKILEIRKSILIKKVMLGFVINSYNKHDKVFRWIHLALAVLTPIVAVLSDYGSSGIFTIILSTVVAGMIKIKEYVTYDKVRDNAKSQLVKYSQLYDKIESEISKSDVQKQGESEFIHWTMMEFSMIGLDDPELSVREREQFQILCKEKNIPYDEDMDELEKIIRRESAEHKEPSEHKSLPTINENTDDTTVSRENPDEPIPTVHRVLSLSYNKKKYMDSLRKIDVKADIQFAIDRLNGNA